MEIETRETGERPEQPDFGLPHVPLPAKIGIEPERLAPRGDVRDELVSLFIEYLGRENPASLKDLMETIEKGIILRALGKSGGNQKEAARALGLKYTTLNQKVKKFGIRLQRGIQIIHS